MKYELPKEKEEIIKKLIPIVIGLKWYEWSRIATAIEKQFGGCANKVELNDATALELALRMELH